MLTVKIGDAEKLAKTMTSETLHARRALHAPTNGPPEAALKQRPFGDLLAAQTLRTQQTVVILPVYDQDPFTCSSSPYQCLRLHHVVAVLPKSCLTRLPQACSLSTNL